jgi:hypothetical protein
MTDFWIEVMWTLVITAIMVLADFLASQMVADRRARIATQRDLDEAMTLDGEDLKEHIAEMKRRMDRRSARQTAALAWGADLTAVALSLDLAALGLWISDPAMFPFFSRWSTPSVSREIPVWLVVIFAHLMLLMVSIACKHLHGETIEAVQPSQMARLLRKGWAKQNGWMLTSNVVGVITLLSSFVMVTDAI